MVSFESDDDEILDSSIPELSQMQKTSALSKLEKSTIPKVVLMTPEEQKVDSDNIENNDSLEVVSEKEETPPSKSNLHVSFHTPSFLNSSKDDDDDSIHSPPSTFKKIHQKGKKILFDEFFF